MPFEAVERKWSGIISNSVLIVADKTNSYYIALNTHEGKKKFYIPVVIVSIIGSIILYFVINRANSIDIRYMFSTLNITLLFIAFGSLYYYTRPDVKKIKFQNDFDKLKALLIRRIDTELSRNRREEFMEDMQKECNINLYY